MSHHCPLCAKTSADLIDATEHFVVMPDAGALVEGWLLIFPKQHMLALAEMPPAVTAEFDELAAGYAQRLQHHYHDVALFEHGPAKANSEVGCTVDHAHLHLVPTTIDLLVKAKQALPGSTWQPVRHVTDLAQAHQQDQAYLYLEQHGERRAAIAPTFPSQFFRRIIGEALHISDFDWRQAPRHQTALDTALTLTGTSIRVLSPSTRPRVY